MKITNTQLLEQQRATIVAQDAEIKELTIKLRTLIGRYNRKDTVPSTRREAMQAAKQQAMTTGQSARVQSC